MLQIETTGGLGNVAITLPFNQPKEVQSGGGRHDVKNRPRKMLGKMFDNPAFQITEKEAKKWHPQMQFRRIALVGGSPGRRQPWSAMCCARGWHSLASVMCQESCFPGRGWIAVNGRSQVS